MNEDERQTFFRIRGRQVSEKDRLCRNIASVSSCSYRNRFVRYGYNRDHEQLLQVNLAMVYWQKSVLPVAYRLLPGSITNVSMLLNLLDSFARRDKGHLDEVSNFQREVLQAFAIESHE